MYSMFPVSTRVPYILGDSFTRHNGMKFTTTDRDNDISQINCANLYHGGWWYDVCHSSNLNCRYLSGPSLYGEGINWSSWHGYKYSLKSVKMMIRKSH